jgi:hypothetical protein
MAEKSRVNEAIDNGAAAAVVAVVPPEVAVVAVVEVLDLLELPHADAANAVAMTTDAMARPFLIDKFPPLTEDRRLEAPPVLAKHSPTADLNVANKR